MGKITDELQTATPERIRQMYNENKDNASRTEGLLAIASHENTPDDVLDMMMDFTPPSVSGAVFGGAQSYFFPLVTKLHIAHLAMMNKIKRGEAREKAILIVLNKMGYNIVSEGSEYVVYANDVGEYARFKKN